MGTTFLPRSPPAAQTRGVGGRGKEALVNRRRRSARRGGSDAMRFIEVVVVPLVKWAGPGLTLIFLYMVAAFLEEWKVALFIAVTAVLVVAMTSMMPCRVETRNRTPCKKQVRGLWGTCEWHGGYKARLPQRTQSGLMWPRPELTTPPPSGPTGAVPVPPQSALGTNLTDMWMLWLTVAQVVLATIQTLRA
jgi:hypothetical protein